MECFCYLRDKQDKLADGKSTVSKFKYPFLALIFFEIQFVRKTRVVFINFVQRCLQEDLLDTL